MDVGGAPQCLCKPGFTGSGEVCNACSICGTGDFASTPCTPTNDATCSTCSPACLDSHWESAPCGGNSDRVCSPCSQCGPGNYIATFCAGNHDTICAACGANCLLCGGPGPTCEQCAPGFTNTQGVCNPPICGNGLVEGTEVCDDNNTTPGDGCDGQCQVEAGHYCFGGAPSTCRAGNCVADPLTSLTLNDFVLDGAGTASSAGITFSQRSTIRTKLDVQYPILVEVDVVYSGNDITYAGARGPGTRDGASSNEPTDTLRAVLTSSSGLMQLVEGTNTIDQGTNAGFTPTPGIPYRVRYVDDGLTARIEWFNVMNPFEAGFLGTQTSFHGNGDRAFVGGGDQGTVSISLIEMDI